MNKLAIFVEGYTEAAFVKKLIEEIAGQNNVRIDRQEVRGGRKATLSIKTIEASRVNATQKYFVLIVDCGSDESVQARILDQHQSLSSSGYSCIVGIRDVRPRYTFAQIPNLEIVLQRFVNKSLIPVKFILAVMETEAWFLAESTHFSRIDPSITVQSIKASLGFDPENDPLEQRTDPAKDLDACYRLGGKSYSKRHVDITVNALDYANLYLELRKKIHYLNVLTSEIDHFLS